ncbi:Rrf2 family transcriptional regulator, partial [bacterium]|nr:Rrf2 family transcriptional regulator [bacterium]
MKFSTKTTYGLRAMIFLARQSKKEKGKSTPISLIAEKEKISNKYLERLFSKLKKDKLIISEKVAGGGYISSRPANTITVYDIIKTLE